MQPSDEALYLPATHAVQLIAPGCPSVSVIEPAGQVVQVTPGFTEEPPILDLRRAKNTVRRGR